MIVVLIEHRVLDFQSMRQDRGTVKDRERECAFQFSWLPSIASGCDQVILFAAKFLCSVRLF